MLKKEELSRNLCIFARERRGERLRVGDQRLGMAAHARQNEQVLGLAKRQVDYFCPRFARLCRLASPRTAALQPETKR